MTDFDTKRVDEVLEAYGSEVVKNMKNFLSFTDNLKDNITSEVKDAELTVTMPYYATFIDKGRRKGAPMPPAAPILEWMKKKSIPLSALYPIRRKIGRDGIEARPFFHFFTDNLSKLYTDVATALEDDVLTFLVENSTLKNDIKV